MLHPITRLELRTDEACFATPNDTIAFGATHKVLLVIHAAEKHVASDSKTKNHGSLEPRELKRVTCEILHLQRVHGRKPRGRAPGEVEAKVVMANVNGANVPILVDEEVDDVDGVQNVSNDDGVGDVAISSVLESGKGDVTVQTLLARDLGYLHHVENFGM